MEQRATERTATGGGGRPELAGLRVAGRDGLRPRWKQRIIPVTLIVSDLVLGATIWTAAYVLDGLWTGQWTGQVWNMVVLSLAPNLAIWVGLRTLLGLYPGYGLGQVEELRRGFYAVLSTAVAVVVFAAAFGAGNSLPRFELALGFLGLLVLVPPTRQQTKAALWKLGLWGKPVTVIGSKGAGARVAGLLEKEWALGYDPVAVFDYDPTAKAAGGEPAGGTALAWAAAAAHQLGVKTVVFATPNTRREEVAGLVEWASVRFRDVLVIPNLAGITNSAVVSRDLAGTFAVEIKQNLLDPWALRAKRGLDLVITSVGGALILPLILVLALLVRLESGGPVFYSAERMGRDGRPFPCPKFRTMVPDAEERLRLLLEADQGARQEFFEYHKLHDDPRVTRVGRFLRKTSLDELPQIWSVLKGEMSLVGPRPYLLRESPDIGVVQNAILRVPPGITGPWQVEGRNQTSFGDRVRMDAHYVRDWSVWLDLVILARTLKAVVLGKGAY